LVFFFLTLPDFWFPIEEDPSKRNVFEIMREKPDVGRKAIALKAFAAKILDVVGKREVHVVSVIPGGLINPLKEKEREGLLTGARDALEITKEALAMGKELFDKNWDDFKRAGDYKTHYIALTNDDALDFYDGRIRVIKPDDEVLSDFSAQDYMDHVEERVYEWTFAKFAYLKALGEIEGIAQVGPTARMNVNKKITTEMANEELKEFKRKFGSPAHSTLLLDYCRLIDLLYACERTIQLLEDESLTRLDTRVAVKPRAGGGIGVVEAPRGTLAHEYVLNTSGQLENMKLIIPTQINNAAINLNVKDAATDFIHEGEVKPGLLNRIEMVIRAYDPCIKCATREANGNVKVEIRDRKGRLLKSLKG
jgi:F420-non-reducing hydrogenase large subunit